MATRDNLNLIPQYWGSFSSAG